MQLPMSTGEVVYSKIAGCLLGLIPVVSIFTFGAFLAPSSFSDVLETMLGRSSGWFMIILFLFFVHLIAYLSLFVKWGAMPLAIAVIFVAFMIFAACLTSMSPMGGGFEGFLILMDMLLIGGMIAIQFGIGIRLGMLAAR